MYTPRAKNLVHEGVYTKQIFTVYIYGLRAGDSKKGKIGGRGDEGHGFRAE